MTKNHLTALITSVSCVMMLSFVSRVTAQSPTAPAATSASVDPTPFDANAHPDWRSSERPEERKQWDSMEGRPAPSLENLTGWLNTKPLSWSDLHGKVVVLDYWSSDVPSCVEGTNTLASLYAKYHDSGLDVIGIHAAAGSQHMASFVRDRKLEYDFAVDSSGKAGKSLGVKFFPCYFVVDRDGIVRVAGANLKTIDEIVQTTLSFNPDASGSHPGVLGQYPKYVAKKLWGNDIRGKKMPRFVPGTWITTKPDTKGKVVLIDFWATWCPPCRATIPELNDYQKKFKDDLVVIGISIDKKVDTVKDFIKKTHFDYAVSVDPDKHMADAIGVQGIPHVIIVSTDGIVRWQGFPLSEEEPLTAKIIQQIIDADPGVAARHARKKTDEAAAQNQSSEGH